MSGFADTAARKIIDHYTGKTAIGAVPTISVALFTAPPTDAGGGTEVTGGAYARKTTAAADWNAAAGSAPATTTNANALAFPTATADWAPLATPVYSFGGYDAATAGVLQWWDYLGNFTWQAAIVASGDVASGLFTAPAHTYVANDPVVFTMEGIGGTIPAGITAGSLYYVIASGLTSDQFKVSATLGGSAVTITVKGNTLVRKVLTKVIQNGDTPSFAAGALTFANA
jgi:hypothetical protein